MGNTAAGVVEPDAACGEAVERVEATGATSGAGMASWTRFTGMIRGPFRGTAASGGVARALGAAFFGAAFFGATRLVFFGATRLVFFGTTRLALPGATRLVFFGTTRLALLGATRLVFFGATRLALLGAARFAVGAALVFCAPARLVVFAVAGFSTFLAGRLTVFWVFRGAGPFRVVRDFWVDFARTLSPPPASPPRARGLRFLRDRGKASPRNADAYHCFRSG